MGEQSPLAVRGQSMQDVIFAGAHGVQARGEAEVEVVLDNEGGAVDLEAGEISILRRLNRAGEGEYRINGARCRLTDVLELLSDTGLGKEMHSVVSQGRVEAIVTSKARDRRLLIEEAAGLGKHRKRRRRAQLKLARTQDNLDRALDVEREARTRLRPLKRQAEAAELHERLERQTDEALWALAREDVRVAGAAVAAAEAAVAAARGGGGRDRGGAAGCRGAARGGRGGAGVARRGARGARQPVLRGAIGARADRAARGVRAPAAVGVGGRAIGRGGRSWPRSRPGRRPTRATTAPSSGSRRSRRSWPSWPRTARARVEREVAALEARRGRGRVEGRGLEGGGRGGSGRARRGGRLRGDGARARGGRSRRAAEAARREAARVGRRAGRSSTSSCARTPAPRAAPRRWPTTCSADPGYELALAAALGPRLRAAVVADLAEGDARCSTARAATAAPR